MAQKLKPGDGAPNFHLTADDGRQVSLGDFRGRWLLLFFFPKALTPGWINEATEFRDAKAKFDKRNAVVAGCSGDKVATLARFRDKYSLNFPLLSDPEFETIEAYGARRMKRFMGKSALGIVRSSVLIGPDGKVRHVWETASSKGHAAQVLEVLKGMAS